MSSAPRLLNDDGTASIATALMSSHHGFRRDLGRFARALERKTSRQMKFGSLRGELVSRAKGEHTARMQQHAAPAWTKQNAISGPE